MLDVQSAREGLQPTTEEGSRMKTPRLATLFAPLGVTIAIGVASADRIDYRDYFHYAGGLTISHGLGSIAGIRASSCGFTRCTLRFQAGAALTSRGYCPRAPAAARTCGTSESRIPPSVQPDPHCPPA